MANDKRIIPSVVYRALAVQEVYLEYKEEDLSNVYVYRKYIYPQFKISERTFYRYLRMNARRQKTIIENEKLTA